MDKTQRHKLTEAMDKFRLTNQDLADAIDESVDKTQRNKLTEVRLQQLDKFRPILGNGWEHREGSPKSLNGAVYTHRAHPGHYITVNGDKFTAKYVHPFRGGEPVELGRGPTKLVHRYVGWRAMSGSLASGASRCSSRMKWECTTCGCGRPHDDHGKGMPTADDESVEPGTKSSDPVKADEPSLAMSPGQKNKNVPHGQLQVDCEKSCGKKKEPDGKTQTEVRRMKADSNNEHYQLGFKHGKSGIGRDPSYSSQSKLNNFQYMQGYGKGSGNEHSGWAEPEPQHPPVKKILPTARRIESACPSCMGGDSLKPLTNCKVCKGKGVREPPAPNKSPKHATYPQAPVKADEPSLAMSPGQKNKNVPHGQLQASEGEDHSKEWQQMRSKNQAALAKFRASPAGRSKPVKKQKPYDPVGSNPLFLGLKPKKESEQSPVTEGTDLLCPNCKGNLGKDRENLMAAQCGNCGHKFHNPEGWDKPKPKPKKKWLRCPDCLGGRVKPLRNCDTCKGKGGSEEIATEGAAGKPKRSTDPNYPGVTFHTHPSIPKNAHGERMISVVKGKEGHEASFFRGNMPASDSLNKYRAGDSHVYANADSEHGAVSALMRKLNPKKESTQEDSVNEGFTYVHSKKTGKAVGAVVRSSNKGKFAIHHFGSNRQSGFIYPTQRRAFDALLKHHGNHTTGGKVPITKPKTPKVKS